MAVSGASAAGRASICSSKPAAAAATSGPAFHDLVVEKCVLTAGLGKGNKQRASLVASLSRSSGEMAATNFFASFPLNSLRGPLCAGEAFWGTRIRIRSPLGGVSLTPLAH